MFKYHVKQDSNVIVFDSANQSLSPQSYICILLMFVVFIALIRLMDTIGKFPGYLVLQTLLHTGEGQRVSGLKLAFH